MATEDKNGNLHDENGRFTEKSASELKEELQQELPENNGRIKVGEITNPIYDDMVLSDGRRVKDILSRVVEIPLHGSAGIEHIEKYKERQGLVNKYIGFTNDIINDPDYVLEDKSNKETILITKHIDSNLVMVLKLNFEIPEHTNTVITMYTSGDKRYQAIIKRHGNLGKVLYKNEKL